ncbi:MAG: HDIG domain-containing protein [Deltaproteobacteria bacterium]|nr:HDIG domain-containing protein [Deltaproteobacteria bacterium]
MNARNTLKLVSRNTESAIDNPVVDSNGGKRTPLSSWIIIFLSFTAAVTALVVNISDLFPDTLKRGDIGKKAVKPIISKREFTFVPDSELIRIKSEEEAKSVKPVFSIRRNAWLDLWNSDIKFAFRALNDPIFRGKDELARERFNSLAGTKLEGLTFWSLYNTIGMTRVKQNLRILYSSVLKDLILVEDRDSLKKKHPKGVEVLSYSRDSETLDRVVKVDIGPDYKEVVDLKKLSALFESEIETRFALGDKESLDRDSRRALLILALSFIKSHLNGSGKRFALGIESRPELTEKRRKEIRRNYTTSSRKFFKGSVILKSGERVTLETVKIQNSMIAPLWERILWFLGYFGIITMFFALIGWSATLQFGGKRGSPKDFVVAGLLIILVLSLVKTAVFISGAVYQNADPVIIPAIFPAAGSAILVRVLMGARMSVFFIIAVSFLATWGIQGQVHLALYYFITGLISSGMASKIEHRYVLWKAGLGIIVSGLLVMGLYRLVSGELFQVDSFRYFLAVGIGGVILSVILSALLPLVEHLGDYITDIKMLELANTEHPLLVELREKASGTFQHSQQVSELAFSAAKRVGANGLLVKIAAMYHDIGKTRQPKYFIENQAGDNPHNKLKPSMSALVIKNHVKDSREILEKAGFPMAVIDTATSHHGSTLIEYFYSRAKENAGPEEVVSEDEYRYPGPIPQTREAGILMLADTVEAAVKSKVVNLQNSGRNSKFDVNTIKETVLSIINKKFTDGQLDACELTLRDLSIIASSFIATLSSMHHERVAYPGQGDRNANRRNSSALPVVEPDKERVAPKESRKGSQETPTAKK